MLTSGPVPAPGRCGLAERDPAETGRQVLAAWDAFLDVVRAPSTDLTRPSRLPGILRTPARHDTGCARE